MLIATSLVHVFGLLVSCVLLSPIKYITTPTSSVTKVMDVTIGPEFMGRMQAKWLLRQSED